MRQFLPCVCLFLMCSHANGQTFSPTPEPTVQAEIGLELANEVYLYFENHTNELLQLRWRRMEESIPSGWNVDLCDYGECYIGVPPSAYMKPAPPGIQPYLKLIVQPGVWPGSAWYWFRIYNAANQSEYQDVYFSLHTPGVTGVQTADKTTELNVFPNPATDFLSIQNDDVQTKRFQLIDPLGNTRLQTMLVSGSALQIDVSAWPAGAYTLVAPPHRTPFLIVH